MWQFRKDGQPSNHREPGTPVEAPQDCSHWCLPGVPDTWNELLYAHLLSKGFGNSIKWTRFPFVSGISVYCPLTIHLHSQWVSTRWFPFPSPSQAASGDRSSPPFGSWSEMNRTKLCKPSVCVSVYYIMHYILEKMWWLIKL